MTPQEYSPQKDLDRDLVVAYAATFIPRNDLYPLQLEDGTYTKVQRTLYPDLIAAHLNGFITIGAYALDQQNMAKWLCLDADDGLRWYGLVNLARNLSEQSIPSYLEASRRGGHLWLFTTPRPGIDIRRFGKQLLDDHHLPEKRGKIPGIELYPKQDVLVTGPGSFVRLPLGKHHLTGHRYHFVSVTGEPLAPTIREQIRLLTQPQWVPQGFLEHVLGRAPATAILSPTPKFEPKPEPTPGRNNKRYRRDTHQEKPSTRIKATMSVLDFVSQYVALTDQGKGHCPFHDDQRMSFGVNPDHNFWYCFACERGYRSEHPCSQNADCRASCERNL